MYMLANTGVLIQLIICNYLISTANFPGAPYVDNAKRKKIFKRKFIPPNLCVAMRYPPYQ